MGVEQQLSGPPAETWKQESRRRIEALETHLTDLEERLNARGVFSGPSPADQIHHAHCYHGGLPHPGGCFEGAIAVMPER